MLFQDVRARRGMRRVLPSKKSSPIMGRRNNLVKKLIIKEDIVRICDVHHISDQYLLR
jgi:hypothetical protein